MSVEELKRAWHAVKAGDFRRTQNQARRQARGGVEPDAVWTPSPGERVLPVVGAAGSVGASTVALAIALAVTSSSDATERNVRIIECCSSTSSGLAAATTAELGLRKTGWQQGTRDCVLIERTSGIHVSIDDVPLPTIAAHADQVTILDVGRGPASIAAGSGWLPAAVRVAPVLVVVTTATVPGLRRLDAALDLLEVGTSAARSRVVLAVVGPRRSKWPRGVEHAGGSALRRLGDADRVVEIPHDRSLAVTGPDSRPLPEGLTAAAARLLTLTQPV